MSRPLIFGLLLACLLGLSSQASAAVYTYTDAQGNQVFTDQPRKNAKRVEVPPANSSSQAPAVKKLSPVAPHKPTLLKIISHYTMLRILVPEPDAIISNAGGEVIVTVSSDPDLQNGDLYQVLLDDKPTGAPGSSPVIALQNVDRGLHQLAVEIIDSDGKTVERTAPQKFSMQRISLAQKRRVTPCATADYGVRPECPLSSKPADD